MSNFKEKFIKKCIEKYGDEFSYKKPFNVFYKK